jgi:RNA polymerase sigma-70 factor (ECF subfamily)
VTHRTTEVSTSGADWVDALGAPQPREARLLARLRDGDEAAFASLVDRYHASLLRLASSLVGTREAAEDVVQETWLGVLSGIGRFEARSSLRTWIFRILTNRARTRRQRDARTLPFSAAFDAAGQAGGPSVDPERFLGPEHRWAGRWSVPPQRWAGRPEDRLLARETMGVVRAAIEALPPSQRAVIVLHDVEGLPAEEVCELLEVSPGNQRVLLHRARTRVREALDGDLGAPAAG